MKRFLAILLAAMLACTVCMAGLSEDASSGDSAGDSAGASSGMPADGTIPDMGEIPADDGASSGDSAGDSAGGSSGMGGAAVEGQLGSWNGGGTNADAVEGNDYAYDAALYITAEGVDAEKSE